MPRSQNPQATALKLVSAHEVSGRRSRSQTKRLSKRVVQKTDGRYLIYYEQSIGPTGSRLARKA